MAKEFLGVGWKFPVNVDAKGDIQMSEYEEDIKEAIWIILIIIACLDPIRASSCTRDT